MLAADKIEQGRFAGPVAANEATFQPAAIFAPKFWSRSVRPATPVGEIVNVNMGELR